jgi:hypothetical protein
MGDDTMRPARTRYLLLTAATVAAGLAGYTGYLLYPRSDLPSGAGAELLLLAAAAGIASIFSPCSFPLLLSVLARAPGGTGQGRTGRALGVCRRPGGRGRKLPVAGGRGRGRGRHRVVRRRHLHQHPRAADPRRGRCRAAPARAHPARAAAGLLPWLEPAIHGLLRRQANLRRRRPLLGHAMFGFGYVLAGFG